MLLERSHEGVLVLRGLEATVAELGAGVDELQLDVFESLTLGVHQEGLKEKGKTSKRFPCDGTNYATEQVISKNQTNALTSRSLGQLRKNRTFRQLCPDQSRHRSSL